MQFQCRISQRIRNTILAELRANGANDHALCAGSLDNEPPNHHVVARLNKGARGDVPKLRTRYCPVEPEHLIGFRRVYAASCSPTAPTRADSKATTRILPGGRVIRRDCAIAPAPFALGAVGHVGLDLDPVGTRIQQSRCRQVYGERAAVLHVGLMSRAVNPCARKSSIICIKKYIPIDGWSRPIEIHAIRVDRLHIPSLTRRHDKVVRQIGIGRRKIGERG